METDSAPEISGASQQLQRDFAAHLRSPDTVPMLSGLEDRRVQIYRDLIFNNVANFLAGQFPVLCKILSGDNWRDLIRDFLFVYKARTPYYTKLSAEFVDYLEQREANNDYKDDPPFLAQLGKYEWIETELFLAADYHYEDALSFLYADAAGLQQSQTSLSDNLQLQEIVLAAYPLRSPLAVSMHFDFEVHKIRTDFQPREKLEHGVFLMAYRDQNNRVKFMELNAVTVRMLELCDGKNSGRTIFDALASEIPGMDRQSLEIFGMQTLLQLGHHGILSFNQSDLEQ